MMMVTMMPSKLRHAKRKADVGRQVQRHIAEARDGVHGETQHLAQRVLRLAGEALRPLVFHADLLEADPTAQPAHEAVLLAQPAHGEHDAAVHEPEIARVQRNVDVGDALQEAGRRGWPSTA